MLMRNFCNNSAPQETLDSQSNERRGGGRAEVGDTGPGNEYQLSKEIVGSDFIIWGFDESAPQAYSLSINTSVCAHILLFAKGIFTEMFGLLKK